MNKDTKPLDRFGNCDDAEAYRYVATRTPFNGSVFSSDWMHNDDKTYGDQRYVVKAWDVGFIRWNNTRYTNDTRNMFTPLLIWEGHRDRGLWYGVTGVNAWMCNALILDLIMDGEMVYPLTPKEMLVMRDYGIGGVSLAMGGTGIEGGEQAS